MSSRIHIEDADRGAWTLLGGGATAKAGPRVLVVLAGAGFHPDRLVAEAARVDAVVAADGGAELCVDTGIPLAAVVGDFDSLSDLARTLLDPALLVPSDDPETNDLEKALALVARRWGPGAAVTLAAGGGVDGGRMDHAIANLGPLLREPHARISMLDGEGRLFALRAGRVEIDRLAGGKLSILPWSLHGARVSATGVRYPLDRALLHLGGRGVSNVLSDEAVVEVHEGVALVWVEA